VIKGKDQSPAASTAAQNPEIEKIAPKDNMTLYEKIAQKKIEAEIVWNDQDCIAFIPEKPESKVHFIVCPKVKNGLASMNDVKDTEK